jgi:hypothetical protein
MIEWIKVEDRLPEIKDKSKNSESKDVLILDSDNTIYVGYLNYYPIEGYRKKEEYIWRDRSTGCGCCSTNLTPTHWMTLPELPKDVE